MKIPDAEGVPLMVMVLPAQVALTPAGKPLAPETASLDIPVAPVVAIMIEVVKAVFTTSVGFDDAVPAILAAVTVMIPVAFTLPHPPVNGIL